MKSASTTRNDAIILVANDWKYLGEGGKHAIFSYNNSNGSSHSAATLLRIDKDLLAISPKRCSQTSSVKDALTTSSKSKLAKERQRQHEYFRKMVGSFLQQFIDLPETISMEWSFLAALRESTLCGGNGEDNAVTIPDRRRSNWTASENDSLEMELSIPPVGLLLRDYRFFTSNADIPDAKQAICLEIKPKAGYTAISPLISEQRLAKFSKSRFTLLKQAYLEGRLQTKDWMDASDSSYEGSLYDPLDLFSNDADRIRQALHRLLVCPLNNLKMWAGEMLLLGSGAKITSSTTMSAWKTIADAFDLPQDAKTEAMVCNLFLEITATLLLEEDFLTKLQKLQRLDVLDADGAIAVYQRLVKLCEGNHKQAEDLLDSATIDITPDLDRSMPINGSPFVPPASAPNLDLLLPLIVATASEIQCASPNIPRTSMLHTLRTTAQRIVDKLAIDECLFLLQTWLFSLTICDISFFLSYQAIAFEESEQLKNPKETECLHNRPKLCHILSRQSVDLPGRVAYRSSPSLKTYDRVLCYKLKAIDFDRKPARKLRTRHLKESCLDDL